MKLPLWALRLGERALSAAPPERAHDLAIALLERLPPAPAPAPDSILAARIAGLDFANPLGLAAGFDKDARVFEAMFALGFGFVEVGGVTPRPQTGNPRPRVFRLPADRAVINRMGLNNAGAEAAAARLAARRRPPSGPLGVNLGANKDSADRIADYVSGLRALYAYADYFTINISSPNTPGLRALQSKDALAELLGRVADARAELAKDGPARPVFLKVAPDLTDADKADIAAASLAHGVDGLVVSNTTIARPGDLASRAAGEAGGLSGRPLFAPSTALLREFYRQTDGRLPLIGVGGVASARDAYVKILNGASLVQLYTGMIYEGAGLPGRIVRELPIFLKTDGFASISAAVGADVA
ncbi:MAG: quinone-dependent dihydroorotate dehydrogenase [Parvularculaceae bacterium]